MTHTDRIREILREYSGAWNRAFNEVPSIDELPPYEHTQATAKRCREIEKELEDEAEALLAEAEREAKIAFLQEMLDTADESADTYKWSKKSYREYLEYELGQLKGEKNA